MLSEFATENYLKVIVKNLAETGRERIGTGELARLLGVTPGTATSMIKKLARSGLLEYESHEGCGLTEAGRRYGINMLRRHRLIELFLVNALSLDWTEVHEEAENLEHAVSDKLIDIIDAHLGHPSHDPHGDIIPAKNQNNLITHDRPLVELPIGQSATISRVEGSAGTLTYFKEEGLVPGQSLTILSRNGYSGLVGLKVGGREAMLAQTALAGVYVEK